MSFKINPFTGEFDLVGEENNQPQITEETDPVFQAWLNSNPLANLQVKNKYLFNVTVLASDFVADTTYIKYPFKAVIPFQGITSSMLPKVIFNCIEADSDNYARVCTSGNNTVTIYVKNVPTQNIVIPVIKVEYTS